VTDDWSGCQQGHLREQHQCAACNWHRHKAGQRLKADRVNIFGDRAGDEHEERKNHSHTQGQ